VGIPSPRAQVTKAVVSVRSYRKSDICETHARQPTSLLRAVREVRDDERPA
jgi:hypothetical protein